MTNSLLTEEPPKSASFMSTPTITWRSLWPLQLETSSGIISRTQWNRFFILSSCWFFSPKKKKNNDIKVWVFQGVTKNFCWLANTVTPTLGPTTVFPHRGFYYNGRQDQACLDHVRFSVISTGDRYLFRDLIGWSFKHCAPSIETSHITLTSYPWWFFQLFWQRRTSLSFAPAY